MRHRGRSGFVYLFGSILIVIGVLWVLRNMGVLEVPLGELWHKYWPGVLVFLGLWIIGRSFSRDGGSSRWPGSKQGHDAPLETDRIDADHTFGGVSYVVDSREFRGGKIRSRFGKVTLDLRRAFLPSGEWTLDVVASMGEVVILAERRMPLSASGTVSLGELEIYGSHDTGSGQRQEYVSETYAAAEGKLSITYRVAMGALRIR